MNRIQNKNQDEGMNANNRFKNFSKYYIQLYISQSFPGGASGKESVCQCKTQETGSVPGLGRSPLGGNGN